MMVKVQALGTCLRARGDLKQREETARKMFKNIAADREPKLMGATV